MLVPVGMCISASVLGDDIGFLDSLLFLPSSVGGPGVLSLSGCEWTLLTDRGLSLTSFMGIADFETFCVECGLVTFIVVMESFLLETSSVGEPGVMSSIVCDWLVLSSNSSTISW